MSSGCPQCRRATVAQTADDPDARVARRLAGVVVIRQNRLLRDGGFAIVVLAAVIVYSFTRQMDGGVLLGLCLVVAVVAWWVIARSEIRIEVSAERLRQLVGTVGLGPGMIREQGADLLLYKRPTDGSYTLTLEQVATSATWSLHYVTRRSVTAACTSRGWHIENRWCRERRGFDGG